MQFHCTFENCNKSFPCQSKLQDHLNVHLGIKPFECKICEKSFYSKKYLRAHQEIHENSVLECPNCLVKFNRKSNLKRHMKTCQTVHRCQVCSKVYKKKGALETHVQEKHTKKVRESKIERKLVSCPFCQAEYKGASNCQAHIRAVHEKVRYSCDKCDRSFAYNSTLQRHIRRSHFN